MKGAKEINASDAKKRKASRVLSVGLNIPEGDAYNAINNVRLCTHGDNQNFFNVFGNYNGVKGEDLYNKMSVVYNKLNFAPNNVPSWRLIANPSLVKAVSLDGTGHGAEGKKKFKPVTEKQRSAPALSTKEVSINFRTGEYLLDENSKYIIDREFTEIAKAFGNARVRIEGNTDNVGSYSSNRSLSLRRAQSVASYLQSEHGMQKNRFIIVGNGPDKPIASNDTKRGKAKNRRTDFELVTE